MQKKLLALVIAGLAAGYASAEVKVYGQIDVSMNNYDDTDGTEVVKADQEIRDDWELESNASRIGFKADYAITEELRAIAKVEYEVFVDDGSDSKSDDDNDEFKARNMYAGLQGNWGSAIAGKHDTLVKLAQGKVDRFNDSAADMKVVMVGENRQDNIVILSTNEKSKAMNGFQLSASFMPGEEDEITDSNGNTVDERDSLTDGYGLSASYTNDMIYLAAALDKDVTADGKPNPTDITRLVGELSVTEEFKVGALWQTAEEAEKGLGIAKIDSSSTLKDIGGEGKWEEQDAWLISAQWEVVKDVILKAQYAESEATATPTAIADGVDDSEVEQIAFGVDYIISKEKSAEAKVYAYIASLETPKETNTSDDSERNTFAVGYQLKF